MTTPTKIGRYEVKGELGRGGMATVYRAYDPSFEREVAIKVLPAELMHDPQFRDRFRREIKTIASLEHPAIVPVYDVGEEDGVPYFVMRFMPGGSLTQWIEKGKFSLEDAARIIERLSSALAYAHRNGLIHRDLKPDNILFDNNGDPFISDFGVAKITDSGTNMTGSGIIGTPAYMSPEQAQGEPVDARSDIYGLGVIIFQMLSGHQPYEATTPMGVAVKHITDPVPDILKVDPSLPAATDTVIRTAMAKDRDQRYPTATELSRALKEAAFGVEPRAGAGGTKMPPPAGSKSSTVVAAAPGSGSGSRRGLIIGGAALLLILIAAGVVFGGKMLAPPPPTPTATSLPPTETSVPPTATVPAGTATSALAPVCAPGVIPAPVSPQVTALQFQNTCNNKIGIAVLSIPQGATFVPQKSGISCLPGHTTADGKQLINCNGGVANNLTSFDLKVCVPLPTPSSSVVVGACGSGTEYDYDHACCAPAKPADAGCTLFKVDLPACGP
jgi:tRNA A-37 threonylcarbamoyl transferase component Bud32